jgi:hypothetical protein
MKQAIVIVHNRQPSPWLNDLLLSIDTHYPIIVTNHNGWMIPAIKDVFDNTDFDEVFILNESMIVKDNSIWDIVFKQYAGTGVAIGDNYLMFLGKYLRKYVNMTTFPEVHTKKEDVLLGEQGWNKQYRNYDKTFVQLESMTDTNDNFEDKNGRYNMVLDGKYFKKWKGSWTLDMVQKVDKIQ